MIILLGGSSDTVRSIIADKLVEEHPQWRHLAVEDLAEAARAALKTDKVYDEEVLIHIVCACAKSMQEDDLHLLVSLSDQSHLSPMLQEKIEGDCLSVHLGRPEEVDEDEYDYVMDTSIMSVNDIHTSIERLISQHL